MFKGGQWLRLSFWSLWLLIAPLSVAAPQSLDIAHIEHLFTSNTKLFTSHIEQLSQPENFSEFDEQDRLIITFYQGLAAIMRADYSSAEQLLQKTFNTSSNLTYRYRSLVSLINVYQLGGKFYQAFSNGLQLSEEQYMKLPAENRASGAVVMALALMDSGLYEESSAILKSVEFDKISARIRCSALYLTAQVAYKSSIFVKTRAQIVDANQICYQENQLLYALLTDNALSLILLNENEPAQAVNILLKQRQQAEGFGYENLVLLWQSVLVEALAKAQDQHLAVEARKLEALQNSKAAENSLEVGILMYTALTNAYKQLGDPSKALAYSEKYLQTYQKSHNRQMTAALAYHAALMQAAQRKQEITALSLQAGRLELENALNKAEAENNRLYLGLVAILAVLLASMLFRLHRTRIKLRERVTYDKLTQVFSRDHFEETLDLALQQAQNRQQDLGFILFDLDLFKQVNDSYGHPVGDWVLRKAAAAARECLRKTDAIGRVGGEEFAILLPDCDLAQSLMLAENVRQAIEALDTSSCGHSFKITASLGVAMAKDSDYHVRRLLCEADERMYQAKRAGRNQVMPEETFSVS